MPTSTTNYELIKPGTDDPILIEQLNTNADIIDNALKENADALGGKVDKETGKGLSTNDFTTAEKTKLDDLAEIKSIGTGLNLDDNGELTATGGGSGGTTNYNDLSNKPQINGNTLSGNKTSAQLGLASASDIPTVPITAIQKNGTGITPVNGTVNITVPTTAADVSALPDTTKYAAALSLTINSSTFVMTGQLKDQDGNNLGTVQTIDLPLESVVVGGSYNSQTKKVVLTLQNGNTIEFSVADLVSGLQTELSASNKLNPAYINYDSAHRAVSDTEKSTWNSKQNALTTAQLAAVNSGIDSTKVEQIEKNKNNISTANAELIELVDSGAKNKIFVDKLNTTNANGVTYTINSDGTITVNGTPSGSSPSYAVVAMPDGSTYKNFAEFCNGDDILSGCPTGGSINTYRMYITGTGYTREDFGNGVELTDTSVSPLYLIIYIYNGYTVTNLTFKPMICSKSAWDVSQKYVPYAMTNAEITAWIQAHT